jgi:type II secretory pathway component HofQ
MKKLIILITICLFSTSVNAQREVEKSLNEFVNPDELVSIAEYTPFVSAIEALSQISERKSGKKIVSTAGLTSPIGVEISKLPYMKALVVIVQYNNLEFEERESVIVVRKKITEAKGLTEDTYASVDSREVKISAVFFEADVAELRERGINWEWLMSNSSGVSLGSNLRSFTEGIDEEAASSSSTTTQQKPPEYLLNGLSDFTSGDWTGSVEGVFKFFESENLGEVIARPKVTVRDKMQGKIQIGSDISIKQRDFAGNVIDVFYSTGTIVDVTPFIYNEDNQDYILLKVSAERSSAIPGEITTEIKKTLVTTDLLMVSGEEKVIGGLFINEEINIRQGIPILKDLPWWVFGLRYLTGYDKKQISKKEVIILLQAELVPTIKERVAQKKENQIERQIIEDHADLKKYKLKPFRDDNIKGMEDK